MEKILELKIYNGRGVESTPFPNADNPIEIGAFRYDAKRMGGAPTITASVNYPTCLDDEWTDKVYALFNGEKYFLKQTPTSSYDNTDVMYKHDIELVSERSVLDNVYFFDVVTGDPMDSDKPVSNSTNVVFFGDVRDFAKRLKASLAYSGIDYDVVVDDEITTEEKLMSFEDQFFSNVLQAIYNTYEVPYYFDGKTIHIGFAKQDVVIPDLSYGVDNALLSVTKSNANYKTVNRATGYGSTDNIPFYYPNDSPKGEIVLSAQGTLSVDDIKIFDKDTFGFSDLHVNRLYTYKGDASQNNYSTKVNVPSRGESVDVVEDNATINKLYIENNIENIVVEYDLSLGTDSVADIKLKWQLSNFPSPIINMTPPLKNAYAKDHLELEIDKVVSINNSEERDIDFTATTEKLEYYSYIYYASGQTDSGRVAHKFRQTGISFSVDAQYGQTKILVYAKLKTIGNFWDCVPDYFWGTSKKKPYCDVSFSSESSIKSVGGWQDSDGNKFNMKDCGITFLKNPSYGDSFSYSIAKYVKTSQNLMPSVYRQSDAKERFYNAVNYPYSKPEGFEINKVYLGADGYWRNEIGEYEIKGIIHNDAYKDDEGNYIHFDHPYVEGKAREHIVAVEDIKPTIKDTVNAMGLRMDMFSEFAYDDDDNDETIENEEGSDRDYVHSYFFGKLRKLDFNLFDCAIEQQPMTISFTSGACGACNFEIGVTEEFPQKNPVQVDSEGNLVRRNGRVVCGQFEPIYENELQPEQQDTINNEVWIALKKEDQAYGELMPKAPVDGVGGHRPKAARNEDGTPNNEGDTFVILGIHLPDSYIDNAERKLEKEIIKYIKDNNEEKFTFGINFSRIYLEENPDVLSRLSENSKIRIFYDEKPYDLYVSSFSYTMNNGDVLPDIRIDLDETLKVSQNPIQKAVNQVKSELGKVLGNIDVVGAATPYFIRKDADDEARGTIDFKKGVKFGEGGKVEILDNNSAKLTIEYLEVTKKASFTSLEIQEKTHVGGQILVTPAAINCGEVEEIDNAYRCYFQTKGEDGDEIFNQFALGDQAICQTFNTWGSRYYWRKVVGVGEDYIDLSNVEGEYDEDSDAPMAGDKIIQLGNQSDTTRQNAIVIAAYGDGSPYIIQYKGINAFEIPDDKIVTKLSSTENIFTGKVHMELGSSIPEEVLGDLTGTLENAIGQLEFGKYNLLRNSGFTGDFVTESLDKTYKLGETTEMFSDPLRHWTSSNASVQASEVGQSGKEISLANGTLSQALHDKIIVGENYVLSFRAKGTSFDYSVGGVEGTVALEGEWMKYVHKFKTESDVSTFVIKNANAIICDLQLERGTVQSAWGYSMWDNQSELARYQALAYLESAIKKGSTDIVGGLILSNLLLLGNSNKNDNTAGVSGFHNDDNDVAFWGGGTWRQALDTIMKYVDNPNYQPSEEEVATMANFVVTHGGRAILNEAIVRGDIYANNGRFRGVVEALSGVFNNVDVQSGKIANFDINGSSLGIQEEVGGNGMSLYNKYISFYDKDTREKQRTLLARIGAYEGVDAYDHVAEFENESTNVLDTMGGVGYGIISNVSGYTNSYAFASKKGVFAGFRPHVAILGSSNDSPLQLGKYHHTVLALYGGTIVLDGTPENGQEYEIICPNTSVEEGRVQVITYDGVGNIYLMYDGIKRSGFSAHDLGGTRQVVKLVYFDKDKTWFCWHHTY